MSRRSRKQSIAGKRRLAVGKWALTACAVLVVTGLIGGYLSARAYLHSEGFRTFLSRKVNAAAGVEGGFGPFRWQGLSLDGEGYQGEGDGLLRKLDASGLHTEIGLGGLGRGSWQVRNSRVNRISAEIDATRPLREGKAEEVAPVAPAPGKVKPGWLPRKVDFDGVDIADLAATIHTKRGQAQISGMALEVRRDGGPRSYRLDARDGRIGLPLGTLREIRLDSARLCYHEDTVFLSKCEASAWSGARLSASGEWNVRSRHYSLAGELAGVRCEEVLPLHWARRVSGVFTTTFEVEGGPGKRTAAGSASLRDGSLTALPLLDSLAAYLDTARFRTLPLTAATVDWERAGDRWWLRNIEFSSEGMLRMKGDLSIGDGGGIQGDLLIGVSPSLLAKIPGAENRVFQPGAHGMWWTGVRVSGTTEKPKEDLTDRLIAAAGLRMIETLPETGEKVLRFSRSILSERHADKVGRVMEKSTEFLRENQDVMRGAQGILEGLLRD